MRDGGSETMLLSTIEREQARLYQKETDFAPEMGRVRLRPNLGLLMAFRLSRSFVLPSGDTFFPITYELIAELERNEDFRHHPSNIS